MKFVTNVVPIGAAKHYEAWAGNHDPVDLAVLADELGYDYLGAGDHPFPTTAFMADGGHHHLDPFVELSFYARATRRVRLLTYCVGGYRNPYLTAKSIASLDRLSGGRFCFGVFAGYLRPELEVLGGRWEGRGARLDEALDVIAMALTGEVVEHAGLYFPASGHLMLPRPAQRPRPPIWIGGNSEAAMWRAARHDGWMPHPQGPELSRITLSEPLDSFELLGRRIRQAQSLHAELGFDQPLEVWSGRFKGEDGRRTDTDLDRLAKDLSGYEEAGVTVLDVSSNARSWEATRDYLIGAAEVLGLRR